MNKNRMIHETIVRDIIDIATDVKNSDEVKSIRNRSNGASFRSITAKSEALTMVFPVGVSRNCSYSTAAMISKANERKCVAMLHMLFTAANITDATDGVDYISRFHTNLKTGRLSVDDFMNIMDDFVEENGLVIKESTQYNEYKTIQEDMKAMNMYFEVNNLNESGLEDYNVINLKEGGQLFIKESDEELLTEAPKYRNVQYYPGIDIAGTQNELNPNIVIPGSLDTNGDSQQYYNNLNNSVKTMSSIIANNNKNSIDAQKFNHQINKDNNEARRQAWLDKQNMDDKQRTQSREDQKSYFANQKASMDILNVQANIAKNRLVDQDVKKANELVPTLMYVNFVSAGVDDKYPIYSSVVIGVKCKLYPLDGADMMNRMKVKYKDKNLVLNLIRASTREISFCKDFLFAVDKAKIDALSQSRRGSSDKIWKILERRAIKSRVRRSLSMVNDATAITTLVMTSDEIEFLKKTEYIDLENPAVIRGIMDSYNLMGFVIVDDVQEIAKFIYDTGNDTYELITYDNLEKEAKDNSKKIINLMSKMR